MSALFFVKIYKGENYMAKTKLGKDFKLNGTACWAHTDSPETYEGNELGYSIMVQLESDEKTEAFKNALEEYFNEVVDQLEKKPNRKVPMNLSVKEDKEYGECFKAKTKHEYKNKQTGELIKKKLAVFDKYGEPLPLGTKIGNGSKVQVAVTASPYVMNAKNYGITLRLNAVLVKDLKEYGNGSADSYGFDIEDKGEVADTDDVEW